MPATSIDKAQLKVLLLEGLHPGTVDLFKADGYTNIQYEPRALSGKALREALLDTHFVGIRSRSQLTAEVLGQAPRLTAVGCFCIGTNQVALDAAQALGIPVFNAPFANTRSVAELVLGEMLLLSRGVPAKNAAAHRGEWQKSATGSHEIRGKTLGIIGYGHIGTQLGILAESLGMRVLFHDIENKLTLGNASQVGSLDELLERADIVTLHVPATELTERMIGNREISRMRTGSILVNASRGSVVDIDALAEGIGSGHLAGAAVDVFPREPRSSDEEFTSPLRQFDNVILTPHIGGSTQEAQANIGIEVAEKLIKYSNNGTTLSAVNFPEVALPEQGNTHRLLHIHHNRPGVLSRINEIFSANQINIASQFLQTSGQVGYVVTDVDAGSSQIALEKIRQIPGTIRARVLY